MREPCAQRPDWAHEATTGRSLGPKPQEFTGEARKVSKGWIITTWRSSEESGVSTFQGDGHLWKMRTSLERILDFLCEPGQLI